MELMMLNRPDEENTDGDVEGGEIGKFRSEIPTSDRDSSKPSSPSQKDLSINKQEDQLESTRAKMGEMKEENERLKTVLARIVKDYQSLQMHFFDIVQQEQAKKPIENSPKPLQIEEPEFVSLSLGTTASDHKKEEKASREDDQMKEGLTLGLDCKFESSSNILSEPLPSLSPENSSEEPIKEGEPWPPSKILNNLRRGDDDVTPQTHVKRARVSVRARCDTPTMNDGCQWRKYGQKVSKGNPCPRAYYRCTVAPACPVRKQVQRCVEDMSILITTYEGTHNHLLPVSATAMASTTSAAASMLTSGSSTSRPATGSSLASSFNFPSLNNSMPGQVYLTNQSFSPSPSHPTITLDLTTQAFQLNRFSSNFTSIPRYPPTNFNSSSESNTIPAPWSNNGYLGYGAQPYNKSHMESMTYWQRAASSALAPPTQHNLSTDTIAKAITSDPSFQSALVAAITSYVGASSSHQQGSSTLLRQPTGLSNSKSASASPVDDREQTDH